MNVNQKRYDEGCELFAQGGSFLHLVNDMNRIYADADADLAEAIDKARKPAQTAIEAGQLKHAVESAGFRVENADNDMQSIALGFFDGVLHRLRSLPTL